VSRRRRVYNPIIKTRARLAILVLLIGASIAAALVFSLPLLSAAAPALTIGFLLGFFRSPKDRFALLEGVAHGVLLSRAGRVIYANDALYRLLERVAGSLNGRPLEELCRPVDAASLRALGDTQDLPLELPLLRGNGALVWVQASATRRRNDTRLVTVTDVSARRDAEEKRRTLADLARRQEEQLEHSTRLAELGEMSAAISHELNQPLTGIRNYARNAFYMLEQKPGAEAEVKNNLRLISEQVDRASRITSQMRDLTRRSDNIFIVLELNSVIRESVDFLLPQMKLSEVAVAMDLADGLPSVWGDRIRLAQVFLNLLSNARQAMEGGPTRQLSISSRAEVGAALPVVVEVRDTGRGFSAEQAPRLFQSFYTTRVGGHGLGLSISRAIIQDHGGTIDAVGTPGGGATFTLRLPVARGDQSQSRRSE
jgi:signal transduction histidine kinase